MKGEINMSFLEKIRDFFGESPGKKALKRYDPEFFDKEQNKSVHKDNKFVKKKKESKKK